MLPNTEMQANIEMQELNEELVNPSALIELAATPANLTETERTELITQNLSLFKHFMTGGDDTPFNFQLFSSNVLKSLGSGIYLSIAISFCQTQLGIILPEKFADTLRGILISATSLNAVGTGYSVYNRVSAKTNSDKLFADIRMGINVTCTLLTLTATIFSFVQKDDIDHAQENALVVLSLMLTNYSLKVVNMIAELSIALYKLKSNQGTPAELKKLEKRFNKEISERVFEILMGCLQLVLIFNQKFNATVISALFLLTHACIQTFLNAKEVTREAGKGIYELGSLLFCKNTSDPSSSSENHENRNTPPPI